MNNNCEKNFYLVAGPNGSGKTTLARELVTRHNIPFLNADEIAREQNVSMIQAGRQLLGQVEAVMSVEQSFALETTLSGKFHKTIINMARDMQYKIIFIYVFLASVEQNLQRIQQRVKLGGHNVPEDVVRRRYAKSLLNFEPTYKMSDFWMLYYNGGGLFRLVAKGTTDLFEFVDANSYNLFSIYQQQQLSCQISELASIGARKAQIAAKQAGVPVCIALNDKLVNVKL